MTPSEICETRSVQTLERTSDAGEHRLVAFPTLPPETTHEALRRCQIDVAVDVRRDGRMGRTQEIVGARGRVVERGEHLAGLGDTYPRPDERADDLRRPTCRSP